MTVTVDAERVSPSKALRAAARSAPLLVVTGRALGDLADELGGYEAAARFLTTVATNVGRPIGVNYPTADGSRTMFVAPKGWGEERLAGWAAGKRDELERMFGASSVVREGE